MVPYLSTLGQVHQQTPLDGSTTSTSSTASTMSTFFKKTKNNHRSEFIVSLNTKDRPNQIQIECYMYIIARSVHKIVLILASGIASRRCSTHQKWFMCVYTHTRWLNMFILLPDDYGWFTGTGQSSETSQRPTGNSNIENTSIQFISAFLIYSLYIYIT